MAREITPQRTPNPNAMRFALSEKAIGSKSRSFASAEAARGVGWAERLFALPGVTSVFAVNDFVTVSKAPQAKWDAIVPGATEILRTSEID
jgi:Scaffold protein Nfu/NifU N terminal